MAKITINNYCNLRCPYCFAKEITRQTANSMTMDEFTEIVDFLLRDPEMSNITLVGGEPLLHPEFDQMIQKTAEKIAETGHKHTGISVFTNGIHLLEHLSFIPNETALLINVNDPKEIGKEKYEKLRASILSMSYNRPDLSHAATLGYNISPGREDSKFFWGLVDQSECTSVRFSVVSPFSECEKYRKNKDEYFKMMKPFLLSFLHEAEKRNIKCSPDCGYIPVCYFTPEEYDFLMKMTTNNGILPWMSQCGHIDAYYSGHIVMDCYGFYSDILQDFRVYESPKEVYQFFEKQEEKVEEKIRKNLSSQKCRSCKFGMRRMCWGGCLGFAVHDN